METTKRNEKGLGSAIGAIFYRQGDGAKHNIENQTVGESSRSGVFDEPEKVGFVYRTMNYDQFQYEETNRDVEKIDKLVKEAKKPHGVIVPIIVDENMIVYDGQHRLEACKVTNTPIKYIVDKNVGVEEMISLNTSSQNWKIDDYAAHHAKRGLKAYQEILRLADRYGITVSTIAGLVGVENPSGTYGAKYEAFQNGKARIDVSYVENTLDDFVEFVRDTKIKYSRLYNFIKAYEGLHQVVCFDNDRLVKKVNEKLDRDSFARISGTSDMREELLKVYNHGLTVKSPLKIKYNYDEGKSICILSKKNVPKIDWRKKE